MLIRSPLHSAPCMHASFSFFLSRIMLYQIISYPAFPLSVMPLLLCLVAILILSYVVLRSRRPLHQVSRQCVSIQSSIHSFIHIFLSLYFIRSFLRPCLSLIDRWADEFFSFFPSFHATLHPICVGDRRHVIPSFIHSYLVHHHLMLALIAPLPATTRRHSISSSPPSLDQLIQFTATSTHQLECSTPAQNSSISPNCPVLY